MVYIPDNASFTGSDIKAIVHLPVDTQTKQAIAQEITLLELQRADLQAELNTLGLFGSEYVFEEQRITEAVKIISDHITDLQGLSTSGSSSMVKVLAELSTISYSIHRETFPVRSLGSVYVRDYTRGPRTIAGSLVFTVFNKHVLKELLDNTRATVSTGVSPGNMPDQYNIVSPVLADQIPPFDIMIQYNNEYGESAALIIYGVQIVNEGQITSVNDLITENQMQFVARDIDTMRDVSTRQLVRNLGVGTAKTTRDLGSADAYKRLLRRRNPFI